MSQVRKYRSTEGSTCNQAAAARHGKSIADLRWINAEISISSVSRIAIVNSVKRMTKRASATESFCSNADKLSATLDKT
ncbi:hypothetical protein EDE08_108158 [Bradyrhizobium sp. R2.2-H]|nr:hypothetical protein EDE10_108158 [Bradyrhizobium sp. Y-H1]TCU70902.1 hypothetical protein EDE08_108158 [Bradyrhizobium sp. R2.2-H]